MQEVAELHVPTESRYEITSFKAKHVKMVAGLVGKLMGSEAVRNSMGDFVAQSQREASLSAAYESAEGEEKEALGRQLASVKRGTGAIQTRLIGSVVNVAMVELPDELDKLVGSLLDISAEEVEDQEADVYGEFVDLLVSHDGFDTFLGSVSKAAKSVSGRFASLSRPATDTQTGNS